MTDQIAATKDYKAVAGRSLGQDAWIRLKRNRAAVASAIVLLLIAMAGIVGPWIHTHPYDRIYPQYVRAPASLEAYPKEEAIIPAFESVLARARVSIGEIDVSGSTVRAPVSSTSALDPRIVRYVDRSDLFSNARLVDEGGSALPEGATSGFMEADVQRLHFLFGTDANGRDVLARTLIGVRISLAIGVLASVMALLLGVTYGAVAGYMGGRIDNVMMRIIDILYSLPFIFFVILLVVFFGRSFVLIFIAIGCTEWLDMARIVRGQTLTIKRQEYVQAAEALGVSDAGIVRRHIIPNALGPVVVFVTLLVPKAILLESLLSFLGLGVQEPLTSLGLLIAEGASNMRGAAWLLLYPAVTLTAILFALNFLGDGLRDALDPKDR
ncbi:oligopeptide transport system permease protein [Aquamicrobium aerolatum DSM 21857]|uniref:Oligopeptide transport system permease protein OppC n=2 Tax=Aerobium TaxID=3143707 RepID=A0A1I3RUD9_9HYPH|nr:ABC transporter permease subunit [Aquamicrobium aerolatum]SFJ49512.1 oligopeptide transport system permease protein [Aquamicrobium aerolatum DSM 21857]